MRRSTISLALLALFSGCKSDDNNPQPEKVCQECRPNMAAPLYSTWKRPSDARQNTPVAELGSNTASTSRRAMPNSTAVSQQPLDSSAAVNQTPAIPRLPEPGNVGPGQFLPGTRSSLANPPDGSASTSLRISDQSHTTAPQSKSPTTTSSDDNDWMLSIATRNPAALPASGKRNDMSTTPLTPAISTNEPNTPSATREAPKGNDSSWARKQSSTPAYVSPLLPLEDQTAARSSSTSGNPSRTLAPPAQSSSTSEEAVVQTSRALVVAHTSAVAMPPTGRSATDTDMPESSLQRPPANTLVPEQPGSATLQNVPARSGFSGQHDAAIEQTGAVVRSTTATVSEPGRISSSLPAVVKQTSDSAGSSNDEQRPVRPTRYVNTKTIKLNYKKNNPLVANLSGIELWYTKDTQTWKRYGTVAQQEPPYIIEVAEEGLYGFSLLPAGSMGMEKGPRPGSQPQIWVDVDLTRPVVRLLPVELASSGQARTAKIRWTATDKNIGKRPVSLFYAEQANGPWTVIATDLENSGCYTWQVPSYLHATFMTRIEARDLAGNVGTDQCSDLAGVSSSQSPIAIDIDQPPH